MTFRISFSDWAVGLIFVNTLYDVLGREINFLSSTIISLLLGWVIVSGLIWRFEE